MGEGKTVARREGGRRRDEIVEKRKSGIPSVSVITAVYNAKDSLEATIQSVLGQGYPDLEFVIVDGGSVDGTLDVIQRYDDRIEYWISEPDRGIYDAFNKGVDCSRGEWLYFLGAGDRLKDGKVIERFFSSTPRNRFLYGNVSWGDTGKIYDGKFTPLKISRRNICQQAIFYHRSLFEELGKFDTRYPILADWEFNVRCFGARNVRPLYRNIIVAEYQLGGISKASDPALERDKERLIRKHLGKRTEFLYRAYRIQKRFFTSLVDLFRLGLLFTALIADYFQ